MSFVGRRGRHLFALAVEAEALEAEEPLALNIFVKPEFHTQPRANEKRKSHDNAASTSQDGAAGGQREPTAVSSEGKIPA
jgi:hypothetical protein